MDTQILEHSYPVLGVDISTHSKEGFYEAIEDALEQSSGAITPLFVVTVNPEIAIQAIIDNDFNQILHHTSINTADGVGISWALHYLYGLHVDRITGSDSLENICAIAAQKNNSVFLYGAMPGVADKAASLLQHRINGLHVTGTYAPDSSDLDFEDLPLATQTQLAEANVIFVALGAPAQEKWIHRNLRHLTNCKVIIGIGGSFDFITGEIKRAPLFMRRSGLEWIYRLYLQPSRWRRMLRLPLFALNIILLRASMQIPKTTQRRSIRQGHS